MRMWKLQYEESLNFNIFIVQCQQLICQLDLQSAVFCCFFSIHCNWIDTSEQSSSCYRLCNSCYHSCYQMSSLSLMALMILHFNCSAPLFLQFCWLHYLFSTSPLFANVLMSEFKLFIYCCCAVSLNEYASLTIHHIMHIWSSQFKYNSSCHSHANLWYKDTFHCPCLSQNTSSFYQQSLQASGNAEWSKSLLRRKHTHTCLV